MARYTAVWPGLVGMYCTNENMLAELQQLAAVQAMAEICRETRVLGTALHPVPV